MQATTSIAAPAPVTQPPAARSTDRAALPQYSLRQILAIWAAAALPMGVLAWVVAPAVADHLSGPGALSRALIVTLTAGLVWQFALVMFLVGREQGTLRWSVLRDALWLRAPRAPRTGRRGGRVWLSSCRSSSPLAAEELVPGPANPAGPRSRRVPRLARRAHASGRHPGAGSRSSPRCSCSTPCWARSCCSAGSCSPAMNGAFGRARLASPTACSSPSTTCTCRGSCRPTLLDSFIHRLPLEALPQRADRHRRAQRAERPVPGA